MKMKISSLRDFMQCRHVKCWIITQNVESVQVDVALFSGREVTWMSDFSPSEVKSWNFLTWIFEHASRLVYYNILIIINCYYFFYHSLFTFLALKIIFKNIPSCLKAGKRNTLKLSYSIYEISCVNYLIETIWWIVSICCSKLFI